MQALIKISDKQFLVKEGDRLLVPRQQAAIGETLAIKALAQIDGENTSLATTDNTQVTARVVNHIKDAKIIVFKKKRRKRYQSRNGHRQQLTELEVVSL